jgi:hypothetical protein
MYVASIDNICTLPVFYHVSVLYDGIYITDDHEK